MLVKYSEWYLMCKQVIHQSQIDYYSNYSLNDHIHTFDGKRELYFDSILKLENLAAGTKQTPKE